MTTAHEALAHISNIIERVDGKPESGPGSLPGAFQTVLEELQKSGFGTFDDRQDVENFLVGLGDRIGLEFFGAGIDKDQDQKLSVSWR